MTQTLDLALRLQAAPTFSQARSMDGRAYVVEETEPYRQFWLSERHRTVLSLFGARRGATLAQALAQYGRLVGTAIDDRAQASVLKTIVDMRRAGILEPLRSETSRYTAAMVGSYLRHRPFPEAIAAFLVETGAIGRSTQVLDLAGGPGDLALRLARVCGHVTLMDLSRGFLDAATVRARAAGIDVTTVHESCNRLAHLGSTHDVITLSQALYWLDETALCRGVCRALKPGGWFFVIQSSITLADDHPLAFVLGRRSVLGAQDPRSFADQTRAVAGRLSALLAALDPAAQAWGTIAPAGRTFFRQTRPFGPDFARAFLTDRHVASTGMTPSRFWKEVDRRCAGVLPDGFLGTHDWAVIAFRRGGGSLPDASGDGAHPVDIAYRDGDPSSAAQV